MAELIKARGRPIICASGCGSEGVPEEFPDLSALQKPFRLETLAAMIDDVLRPRTRWSPHSAVSRRRILRGNSSGHGKDVWSASVAISTAAPAA